MIGIAKTIKDNVQTCTREQLNQALDSPHVAEVCQAIAEALQKHQQGEMTKEEFEALKSRLKKQLPLLTPHATFPNGRRKNEEAIPNGFSIYDLDHIPNPRAKWAEIEARREELVSCLPTSLRVVKASDWCSKDPLQLSLQGEKPRTRV